MTTQHTSPDANVELIRNTLKAFNANDIDACLAHLAPDFVINLAELPSPLHGSEVWRQGVEIMKRGFPDLHARIEDIFAARDRVADGLIADEWICSDTAKLVGQLK